MASKREKQRAITISTKASPQRTDPRYQAPQPHRLDIERSRLLEWLQTAPNKIIALLAPSGYGKTTLAAQLARSWRQSGAPDRFVAWLSLLPDEAEPERLIRSLAGAVALSGQRLPSWEHTAHRPVSPERHATALASDLNASSHQFLLVVDGLEHLSADSSRSLTTFLRQLDDRHRVVLIGYQEPEGQLGQLLATQALVAGAKHLAFTPSESKAFLERVSRETELEFDPYLAHSEVAGWPAALAMQAHGASVTATSPERLVRSLLEQLPAEVLTALPEVAVLEVWSTERAEAVGCRLPPRWLRLVRRSGIPLIPLGHDTYRPHQLLVDQLEKLLRRDLPRHHQLHQAAARVAESEGLPLLALKHLRIAGDHAEAARVAGEIVPGWAQRSQWKLVRQALDKLPPSALSPALLAWLGIALLETGEPTRGENMLAKLVKQQVGPAAAWGYFGLAIAAYRRGELKQALSLVNDGLEQNPDKRARVQLLRTRAAALASLGNLAKAPSAGSGQALAAAHECVTHAERLADPQLLVQALSVQQYVLERGGHSPQALAIGEQVIELATQAGTLHQALPTVDCLFNYYFRHNRTAEISHLVLELLEQARAGYPLAVPWMLRNLGYEWLQMGAPAAALPHFKEATALFHSNGNLNSAGQTLSEVIYCLLRLGRVQEAEALLPQLHELLRDADDKDSAATRAYTEGLVRVYQGRATKAERLLKLSLDREGRAYPVLDELRAVAYLAEIARRVLCLKQQHIAALMDLLDRYGNDWFLTLEAEPLADLYQACIAQGWFAERLRPHLKPTVRPAPARPVLELRTLGKFRATVNGQPLDLLPKERELLTFLAMYGPVHRTSIIDALWPELDLDTGRYALNTQVYNLRAALSVALGPGYGHAIKFDRDNVTYGLIPELSVRLDTAALEAVPGLRGDAVPSQRGEALPALSRSPGLSGVALQSEGPAQSRSPESLDFARDRLREGEGKANANYGAFLEGCEAEWVITRRSYYRGLVERASST